MLAVSDGSFIKEEKVGAAAWIIESNDQLASYEGTIVTSGGAEIQNAYRSELFGILGILTSIKKLCNEFNITRGRLSIYCDGESVVKRINNSYTQVSNNSHHFDVINSILCMCDSLPVSVTFLHVKGHQDKYMPYSNLDHPSQLNILVDHLAKRAATAAITS